MIFQVRVPNGVRPGQTFKCAVNGQHHVLTCPPNAQPGQTIQFNLPDNPQQQQQQQQQQYTQNSQAQGYHPPQQQQQPPPYYPQQHNLSPQAIFESVDANRSGHIDVTQLKRAMEYAGYMKFQKKTCKLMMGMFDTDHSMTMDVNEFAALFKYISDWEKCFKQYDRDTSGTINHSELKTAVQAFGYRFSDAFFSMLFKKYDDDGSNNISFDEFIQLFCELHMLTEAFKVKDVKRIGEATFRYEDFLKACMSIHT